MIDWVTDWLIEHEGMFGNLAVADKASIHGIPEFVVNYFLLLINAVNVSSLWNRKRRCI